MNVRRGTGSIIDERCGHDPQSTCKTDVCNIENSLVKRNYADIIGYNFLHA